MLSPQEKTQGTLDFLLFATCIGSGPVTLFFASNMLRSGDAQTGVFTGLILLGATVLEWGIVAFAYFMVRARIWQ